MGRQLQDGELQWELWHAAYYCDVGGRGFDVAGWGGREAQAAP